MNPDPLRAGSGRPGTGRAGDDTPRQRARRERRTAAAPGREAEAEGTGNAAKNRAAARALANAGGERREGRKRRRRRHADGLPLEGREGGRRGPRRSDGPGPRGSGRVIDRSPRRRTGGEKARKRGVSHRQAPNPVRWRFPTRDAPPRRRTTTGPEESPDAPRPAGPTATPQTTDVR